jgi:hypothetical protein
MGLKRSFRARCGNLDRDAGLFSVPGTDNGAAEFPLADAERPGSALDISLIFNHDTVSGLPQLEDAKCNLR